MLKISNNSIMVGVEDIPLFKALMPYAPKEVTKTQIMSDMTTLFIVLLNEYGESELADMIDKTLHVAIKHKDDAEVKYIDHDTNNT